MAHHLNCGIVLARKKGKLPFRVERQEYSLSARTDCIEMHVDALQPGENCLIVDDLLATGGTCAATCQLTQRLGGKVLGCAFVVELPELNGRARLPQYDVMSLVSFRGIDSKDISRPLRPLRRTAETSAWGLILLNRLNS